MDRLAEKYLPEYHFSERHSVNIMGSAEDVFSARADFDFRHYKIIRVLFKLRGLPSRLTRKEDLASINFIELEKIRPEQLAIGLIGQFWKINGNLLKFNPGEFIHLYPTGFTKAVWTFEIGREKNGFVKLSTETRILCIGNEARKKFGRYWFFIRPFSGIIRKMILKGIKGIVEKGLSANSRAGVPLQRTQDQLHS